jgi:hypothetical protein
VIFSSSIIIVSVEADELKRIYIYVASVVVLCCGRLIEQQFLFHLGTPASSLTSLVNPKMAASIVNSVPYPFYFTKGDAIEVQRKTGQAEDATLTIPNVRGRIPSVQASRLRSMMLESKADKSKIIAFPCSYDGLSSRLIEEAGFPIVFLAGYPVSSSHGLPDTGYIAMQEMCDKIQEVSRQVSVPIFADGDTGYGSPLNVRRSVESFAHAGAAGVMIEDQTWPKRKFPERFIHKEGL